MHCHNELDPDHLHGPIMIASMGVLTTMRTGVAFSAGCNTPSRIRTTSMRKWRMRWRRMSAASGR
jgi:hypothetical protein